MMVQPGGSQGSLGASGLHRVKPRARAKLVEVLREARCVMGVDCEELAARAERGELTAKPGTARYGLDAVEAAREGLFAASGARSVEEFTHMALSGSEIPEE